MPNSSPTLSSVRGWPSLPNRRRSKICRFRAPTFLSPKSIARATTHSDSPKSPTDFAVNSPASALRKSSRNSTMHFRPQFRTLSKSFVLIPWRSPSRTCPKARKTLPKRTDTGTSVSKTSRIPEETCNTFGSRHTAGGGGASELPTCSERTISRSSSIVFFPQFRTRPISASERPCRSPENCTFAASSTLANRAESGNVAINRPRSALGIKMGS